MTGSAVNTVVQLLREVGHACLEYQDGAMRSLPCRRLQCDQIWSFVCANATNVEKDRQGKTGCGDVWSWTAICADTRLVPCWYVGGRSGRDAYHFIKDLAGRLTYRVQLTADGHSAYLEAVEGAFGSEIDYAALITLYGSIEPEKDAERRYNPVKRVETDTRVVTGALDEAYVSTSYVGCQVLSVRMGMWRCTRFADPISRKLQNHMDALALYFMHYNFCRPHQTLSKPFLTTPAMAAGLTSHVWDIRDMLNLPDSSH